MNKADETPKPADAAGRLDGLVMPRCSTCRHWGGRAEWANKEHKKTCASPKIEYGYSSTESPNDGADVEDDEGWGMLTGPYFGCVNWQPKEA